MCDCPKDKNGRKDEISPQTQASQPADRRPKSGCCRRQLTYEDDENVTITELPVSIPNPPQTAGVAIVRRRIDFGTSPDRKDEAPKKADDEDKPVEQQQPKDSEKDGEGESPADGGGAQQPNADKDDQQKAAESVVTSTPCPGQLNPNNECHCTPVAKVAEVPKEDCENCGTNNK